MNLSSYLLYSRKSDYHDLVLLREINAAKHHWLLQVQSYFRIMLSA